MIYFFLVVIIFILSLLVTVFFSIYCINLYILLIAARKYKAPTAETPHGPKPAVCIHLPIYNEKYVVSRVVSACAAMAKSYGRDKVRILILDDSDDDTTQAVDSIIEKYRQNQIQIEVLRRKNREGFKAGALQAALEKTSEEYIAIFDADFVPPADFLEKTVPYFATDDRIGIVQSRWAYTNKEQNRITRALSHMIDVHFLIEQTGRYTALYFQIFNGSGGVLRKRAILESGGWQGDTLA